MSVDTSSVAPAVQVRKRSGHVVDYKRSKITQVVMLCLVNDCGREINDDTKALAESVTTRVERLLTHVPGPVSVEAIQNFVEEALFAVGEADAGRKYVLFRDERRKLREASELAGVTEEAIDAIRHESKLFASSGKNDLQRFQHYDKYARFNAEWKRRETYPESATRVMEFIQEHLLLHDMPVLTIEEYNMLWQSIVLEQATPSMRLMQMAGPAAKRCNVGIYNCLRRDTPFITADGVRQFTDFRDGDTTTVLTHTGGWRRAKVRCYGADKLYPLRIARGRSSHVVWATRNHAWLTADGSRTTKVKSGDKLAKPPHIINTWKYEDADPVQRTYWAMGYVYGDGTLVKNADGEYAWSMVRLCGDDGRFLARFQELGYSWSKPDTFGGDAVVYTGRYLKTLPTLAKDGHANVTAFVRGMLDADGHKNTNGDWPSLFDGIQLSGEEAIRFVREVFPVVGAYISREDDLTSQETNYGVRPATSRFGLVCGFGESTSSPFGVQEVGEEPVTEDVWCLEVEGDHSFVLPNGIVTGNCSFSGIKDIDYVAENLYISMAGAGCGFSCESEFIEQMPRVKRRNKRAKPDVFEVNDDTEGWCDSTKYLAYALYDGHDLDIKYDAIRPEGSRLKTKGGTASGPKPLIDMHNAMRRIFWGREGKRLRDIDVHDWMCYVGQVGQLGGVRRAALISLSDLQSQRMREAKFGSFWNDPLRVQRTMANNSATYGEKPSSEVFMSEWLSLIISKSGERGIFNRSSLAHQMPERRVALYGADAFSDILWGCNPCGEIFLHPDGQFCNLSICICRPDDTEETLTEKVRIAAIFGTIQSTMTYFGYLRQRWADNCNRERLLGVDLLGALDCPLLRESNPDRDNLLERLKQQAVKTNREQATRFGIPASSAVTCIKPGGNSGARYGVGQSMSGWLNDYMIRNVEVGNLNPMCRFLKDQGVPNEVSYRDPGTTVFSFPLKAPEGAMVVSELVTDGSGKVIQTKPRRSAIEQLEDWLAFKRHWTEHNPSVTIYVSDNEWPGVGAWVYDHWDDVGGLAFLPLDGGVYPQAPFTPLTKDSFDAFVAKFPKIEWEKLPRYERGIDHTNVRKEVACSGDKCSF